MNTPLHLLEAQKEREASWVNEGAEAFKERLATADATMTPAGKRIIKETSEAFMARLTTYDEDMLNSSNPMKSHTFQIIQLLGVDHVAAVTLHVMVELMLSEGRAKDPSKRTVATRSQVLGRALEHDLRFRACSKGADAETKAALSRMKRSMKGSPRTWRERAEKLATMVEVPWDITTLVRIGSDLIGMLAESAPKVFTVELVVFGNKTLSIPKFTPEASARLLADTEAMSVARPKFGLMLVPPRPWRYAEEP